MVVLCRTALFDYNIVTMTRAFVFLALASFAALWAVQTASQISAPMLGPFWVGLPLIAIGITLIGCGLGNLEQLYRIFPHPISVGSVLSAYGVSIFTQSSSAFWLVCPAISVTAIAHVIGRPHPQIADRFLPPDTTAFPGIFRRFRFQWNVILPWFGLYELCASLGVPRGSKDMSFAFEHSWPIIPWTEVLYFSTYIFVIGAPFFVPDSRTLRRLTIQAWIAMVLIFPIYLTFPTETARHPLPMDSLLSPVLAWERSMDPPSLAFPSFHTTWAFLIAAALPPKYRPLWRIWAISIGVSCVTTGMHSLLDVLAGFTLAQALLRYDKIWPKLTQILSRPPSKFAPQTAAFFTGTILVGQIHLIPAILAAETLLRLGSNRYLYRLGCCILSCLVILRLEQLNAPIPLTVGSALILRAASGFIAGERGHFAIALGAVGAVLTWSPSSAIESIPMTANLVLIAAAAVAAATSTYFESPKPSRLAVSPHQNES